MSVWSNPSYAVEPLRNAANNLPLPCRERFPDELEGIANFDFDKCEKRHPGMSGRNAAEYFRENPKEWRDFCGTRAPKLAYGDRTAFKNTLKDTNCRFGGIRAVYWAFKHFREETWQAQATFDPETLLSYTKKAYTLAAAPSRFNQEVWDSSENWFSKGDQGEKEPAWAKREAIADSVRYLWSKRSASNFRKLSGKLKVLQERLTSSKFKKAKIDRDLVKSTPATDARRTVTKKTMFALEENKASFARVKKAILKKEAVNAEDAAAVSVLPYVEANGRGSRLVCFIAYGCMILYDKVDKESAFFARKDWDRLVQMLQADAKLTMYYSKYEVTEKQLSHDMWKAYEEIMALFLRALDANSHYKCNRYCRAFDVYQFVYLASLAEDINTDATDSQLSKVDDEGLNDIVPMYEYLQIVDNDTFGIKETLELLKFNKIFPCPDFCIYSVCDALERKAETTHPVSDSVMLGVHPTTNAKVTASKEEFKLYMKRSRIQTFFNVHGYLPGNLYDPDTAPPTISAYPAMSPGELRVADMPHVNIRGNFLYRGFDGCENEIVKDKVIAPALGPNDKLDLTDVPKEDRNQVLKYLFSESFLSQKEIFQLAKDKKLFKIYKAIILLALKAEAKKPGSRAFSMCLDEHRRFLSEFEANISVYVSSQTGSSVGKSTMELDQRLGDLAATPIMSTCKVTNKALKTVLMSFDLEGFSPMQNPEFKENGVESWEECFGKEELLQVLHLFTDVELTFIKLGVHDVFKTRGNDLEGLQGKMNTSVHIDLMSYSVSKLRELGLTSGPASLEVLIDDGLLRIQLPRNSHDIAAAVDVIDKMYKFAGQKISWDKTFVSSVMCQYLNRVFYDGIEVTPGAKAFMRIGKKQEIAVPTLVDELMTHASGTRGAIQNGTNHMLAYYAYMVEVYKSLRVWGFKQTSNDALLRMAFATHVPVGLGGFGASTLYGLSTNESFNALQSGIAAMKMICFSFPSYVTLANMYLNSGVRHMSCEAILRNPMAIRTSLRCLNQRRFANAAKTYVLKNSKNALIKEANLGTFRDMEDAIIKQICDEDKISEIKRQLLWNMTFSSYLETIIGKLQSSSTAADMLGARRCFSLLLKNKTEAKALIKETATGNFVKREL